MHKLHQEQEAAAQCTALLQQAWRAWHQQATAPAATACQHRQQHLKQAALSTWAQLPAVKLRLRAIAAAICSVDRSVLMCWGLRAFCTCCSDGVMLRRAARECLRAWGCLAAGAGRQRLRWEAHRKARRLGLLRSCFWNWAQLSWRAMRRATAAKAGELQASVQSSKASGLLTGGQANWVWAV